MQLYQGLPNTKNKKKLVRKMPATNVRRSPIMGTHKNGSWNRCFEKPSSESYSSSDDG
jgi:hypothetical protein